MTTTTRTSQSDYLLDVARTVADAYTTHPAVVAAMATGSAAEGVADDLSDVDMTIYYDTLPDDAALSVSRERVGGGPRRWSVDERPHGFVEGFPLHGIEIQIGHTTVEAWERDIESVLGGEDVPTPLHKAMSGTLICVSLHGAEHMERWQARIRAFPPSLGRAMVEHYLTFFALWGVADMIERRDALVWRYETCVQAAQNVLGVLAGLNRTYYTTFQFKRMREMIDGLTIAPADCAARIERLFDHDVRAAAATMEGLVADVVGLVRQHMPEVDTTRVEQRLGWRHRAWTPVD